MRDRRWQAEARYFRVVHDVPGRDVLVVPWCLVRRFGGAWRAAGWVIG